MNKITLKIPKNTLKYISMQRTDYLKNDFFTHLEERFPKLKNLLIKIKCFLLQNKIRGAYQKDLFIEYEKIKDFLPPNANSILDIGCGMAGIDILLSKHYDNKINLYLIDKNKIEKNIHYQFTPTGSFYNSLEVTKFFLISNGLNGNNIFTQEATDNNDIKFEKKFDIIISLLSWGFHYPINAYLHQVKNKLNPGGILIIDIRKNSNGREDLEKNFDKIELISESEKIIKIIAYDK